MPLFIDKALAQRTERTEGSINASFVEALALREPASGAIWAEIGGAMAMFAGPGSPMTQTFCLGLDKPATSADLDALEDFFFSRGADAFHEVSPLTGIQTFALLSERGYAPVELTSVLVRSLDNAYSDLPEGSPNLRVRIIGPSERETWVQTSVAGWSEHAEIAEFLRGIAEGAFLNTATMSYLVEEEGLPIATGALGFHESVAYLAGASTIPSHRGRGAQKTLLRARLEEARQRGCDIALMGAEPGSTSQRNAQRNGFQVAYTRVKWQRKLPA